MSRFFNRGDKAQFHAWIDEHHRALHRHALWMTGQAELAAELVQETFYQAWKSRRSLRDETRVLGWLIAILRRAFYRELQHNARYEPATLADELIADDAEDRDCLLDLARGLRSLSTAQRDLLLLYALHGYSYAEIGEQLEIPIGTVMSRLSRAREALRAALGSDAYTGNVIPLSRRFGGKP